MSASDHFDENVAHSDTRWLPMVCVWVLVMLSTLMPVDATLAKAVVRGACGIVACAVVAYGWSWRTRVNVTRLCLPWALFVVVSILSVLWSPLKQTSLWQAGSLGILFLLAVSIGLTARSLADLSWVLLHVSSALLMNSTVLLFAYFLLPGQNSLTRVGEGAFHASSASASASLGMMLLAASLLLWGWSWSKWLIVPGLLAHGSVIFLAVNRVAMLLAAILLVLALLMAGARNRVFATAGVLVLCLLGSIHLALDPGMDKMAGVLSSTASYASREQTSQQLRELSGRSEMWSVVWTEYLRSPWIGHGYFVSSPEGQIYVWQTWGNWTAHNVVLQCLMSVGLLGLLLGLWGVARLCHAWWRSIVDGLIPASLTSLFVLACIWNIGWGSFSASFLGPMVPESICVFGILGVVIGQLASAEFQADAAAAIRGGGLV